MTDNDIIKALECHSLRMYDPKGACKECPYKRKAMCMEEAIADTIALINRQKEEIERLSSDRYLLKEDGTMTLLPRTDVTKIRAEAIKEFAERLKDDCCGHVWFEIEDEQFVQYLDCLVKEMVGDGDG